MEPKDENSDNSASPTTPTHDIFQFPDIQNLAEPVSPLHYTENITTVNYEHNTYRNVSPPSYVCLVLVAIKNILLLLSIYASYSILSYLLSGIEFSGKNYCPKKKIEDRS
jgi:hypothetical protein